MERSDIRERYRRSRYGEGTLVAEPLQLRHSLIFDLDLNCHPLIGVTNSVIYASFLTELSRKVRECRRRRLRKDTPWSQVRGVERCSKDHRYLYRLGCYSHAAVLITSE